MKTVLQELMNGFDAYKLESQNDSITIEKLKEVIAKEYLKKEQQQITTAYKEGWMNPAKFRQHGSEYYYKNLFGDSKKDGNEIL